MTPENCETLTIACRKKRTEAPWHQGDTIFEAARRMGLRPPCSCLAGTCFNLKGRQGVQNFMMTGQSMSRPRRTASASPATWPPMSGSG